MPRESPYEVVLSRVEESELVGRTRKYTLPYYQVQRAKIVLLAAKGFANSEIAERLDTRREVASFWRKRFFDERLAGLEDRTRPGRPPVFPPRSRRAGKSVSL